MEDGKNVFMLYDFFSLEMCDKYSNIDGGDFSHSKLHWMIFFSYNILVQLQKVIFFSI